MGVAVVMAVASLAHAAPVETAFISTPAEIAVNPNVTRAIGGIADLRREAYFGLCDQGRDFDVRCRADERYRYLVHENGITFGRKLGVVKGLTQWAKAVREGPARPGFADLDFLRWTLTTLREKLIKIGAKVTRHSKYVTFQLAEVAVTRDLFAAILDRIARLAIPPPPEATTHV